MAKEVKNCLTEGKVIIRYIRDDSRYRGNHILAGGLHKDCGKELTILRHDGFIIPFLTEDEIICLSKHLGGVDLSWANDKFWRDSDKFNVKLINGDVILDKSKPIDYIKWKYLQLYSTERDLIAPSKEKINDRATYQWYFIEDDNDADLANMELDITAQAYMLFSKFQTDKKTLAYLYHKIEGKYVDANIQLKVLTGWFKPILDKKATLFVRFADDKYLQERVTIHLAKAYGIILPSSVDGIYSYGNTKLTIDPKVGGEEMAVQFISKIENQPVKLEIMGKISQQ